MKCAEENGIAAMFIVPAENSSDADVVQTTKVWRERFDSRDTTKNQTEE